MAEEKEEGLEPHELHQIRLLAKTFKQTEYYGFDHPLSREALNQLFANLEASVEKEELIGFEFTPSQILLNQKATKKEDLQSQALAEGIYKKGISGIRFYKGLTRESLNKFVSVISQNTLPPQGDEFWNLPGLTVWSLILKDLTAGEEGPVDYEDKLRALVQTLLKPVAPSNLTREEELLEWAVQEADHLSLALKQNFKELIPEGDSQADTKKAEALSSFISGLAGAYEGLLPDKKETFLGKMALTITEMDQWERIWFCDLPFSPNPLKTLFNLIPPQEASPVLSQMILSLLNKGSNLASFLKQSEGGFSQFREVMPELKTRLEQAVSTQKIPFADLWTMVQGIFLEDEERQLLDDLYLKQLEGFSENLPALDWEESTIPEDLKKAFGRLFPLEGTEVVVSYLLEFLVTSKDIRDLISWIKELTGMAKELSLSGDVKHLTLILQEVSKAISILPFHDDPLFPEVIAAWEKLNLIDHTEMLLNLLPTAGEEAMNQIEALLPFLSEKTLGSLLRQLRETTPPWGEERFLDFLLSGGKRIIPPLLSQLSGNSSPSFLLKALRIIVHFQVEEAIPLLPDLFSILEEPDKIKGIKILTKLKFPELADLFIPILTKGTDREAAATINDLLQQGNGPVFFGLLTVLRNGNILSRYSTLPLEEKIIRALGKIRYEPAIPVCQSILIEKNLFPLGGYHKIKGAAGYCLKDLGTPEALSILERESHSKSKVTRKICREILRNP